MSGFRMSYMALNRIVEEKIADDEAYRAQLRKTARPLLSDGRAMSDEQLLAKLGSLGIDVSRERLQVLFPRFASAEEVTKAMIRAVKVKPPESEEDWVWIAVTCLWERWRPQLPDMEMIDDKMQAGYRALESRDSVGACRIWMETWRDILALMDRIGIDSLDAFEDRFAGTQSLFNWVQDLENELHNAGLDDPQFFRHRIAVCQSVLDRFADGRLPLENFRSAIAHAHAMLGDYATSDRLFRQWLTERPQWVGGWNWWANANWPHAASGTGDANKVERILREGLSNVKGPDRVYLLQELEALYEHTNREPDAAAVHQEIEQLRSVENASTRPGWAVGEESQPSGEKSLGLEKWEESDASEVLGGPDRSHVPPRQAKVGRNDPCPCGSGKKYKKCCMSRFGPRNSWTEV